MQLNQIKIEWIVEKYFLKAPLLHKHKAAKLSRAVVAGACAFTILPSQGLAADNIHEITVGLTCANVGRETGKWDELEGTGGFLDALGTQDKKKPRAGKRMKQTKQPGYGEISTMKKQVLVG